MASKTIFAKPLEVADTHNGAGGLAYSMEAENALAQLVATSTFNDTYYATGEQVLDALLKAASQCSPEYVAKAALYGHEKGRMKDAPLVLLAHLMTRGPEGNGFAALIFPRVVTRGKQLASFLQIVRSGRVGRRHPTQAIRRAIQEWFEKRSGDALYRTSVGTPMSFRDILRIAHVRPENKEKRALYGYLVGKDPSSWGDATVHDLPPLVRHFEMFKASLAGNLEVPKEFHAVPDVPFQLLTNLPLGEGHWKQIALQMPWDATRRNLNVLLKNGVFGDAVIVEGVAKKLADPEAIRRSKTFPYDLLSAYRNVDPAIPSPIREALQDAMEVATENVPVFGQSVVLCVDVSGSMSSPITGVRKGASSKVRCIDVAGLMASCVLRQNKGAMVVPFDMRAHQVTLNPRDSVMTNAEKLARYGGGGTDCGSALSYVLGLVSGLPDLVIYVSDNESWSNQGYFGGQTNLQAAWDTYRRRNPKARLVCIDLAANTTTQVVDDRRTLNIGGFSDAIWDEIARFAGGANVDFADAVRATVL